MQLVSRGKQPVCLALLYVIAFLPGSEERTISSGNAAPLIVPWREVSVEKLHIRSDVTYRFAITEVTSEIRNNVNVAKEARFDVRLPETAFISNFTMVIDGVEYMGYVDRKERARELYEEARRRGESAGYVGVQPRNTYRFKLAVNVAPNSTVTFKLVYEDLLQRRFGLYEHVVYIDPGQIVPDMRVDVLIVENRQITELNVPNIRNDLITDFEITDANPYVKVVSQSDHSAHISFAPSPSKQKKIEENGISGQFIVNYDVKRGFKGGEILVANGYFVHFFAPPNLVPMPKSIMFVLDVSGSMDEKKLEQLKDAMESILQDLNPDDDFNIMKFSTRSSIWKEEMVPVSDELLIEAMHYIKKLVAKGTTNINEALVSALSFGPFFKTRKVPMIFFLTDGVATEGEIDGHRLLTNVIRTNENYFNRTAAMFCLAFGDDADFDLVKRIASANNGLARKIYTDGDASLQLAGFYDEISAPVLSDVRIKYLDSALEPESITLARSMTYFSGSELIMSGRMADKATDNATSTIDLSITANDIDGSFVLDEAVVPEVLDLNPATADKLLSITERMWAYLTIKQLQEEATYLDNTELKENLTSEALDLALKYNFVTELTSMVVIKPSPDNGEKNTTDIDPDDSRTPVPLPTVRYPIMTVLQEDIPTDTQRSLVVDSLWRTFGSGTVGLQIPRGHPPPPRYAPMDHGEGSNGGKLNSQTGTSKPKGKKGRKHRKGGKRPRGPKVPPVVVVPLHGRSRSDRLCIFKIKSRQEQVLLLSTKDITLRGTLADVIKKKKKSGRTRAYSAFVQLTLTLSDTDIQMTTSWVKINNLTMPWWRSNFLNGSRFQANITSSKEFVFTTDDGFHLIVSLVGLRSRRSRSEPYLSVALFDTGDMNPQHIRGALKSVMSGGVFDNKDPTLFLNEPFRNARVNPAYHRSLPDGMDCWLTSKRKDRFKLVNDTLTLRGDRRAGHQNASSRN